jgi:hypothetical protein
MPEAPEKELKMLAVSSSNLAAVGYDRASLTMHVRFKSGAVYEYTHVLPETFCDLVFAESVGGYFNRSVKPTHPCRQIKEATP